MKFTYGQLFAAILAVWLFLILHGLWVYHALYGEPICNGRPVSAWDFIVGLSLGYDYLLLIFCAINMPELPRWDFWHKEINLDKIKKASKK